MRQFLRARNRPGYSEQPHAHTHPSFDRSVYKRRNLVERMFCRLKDWRRIATRYDKLARNFMAAVELAATIIW
nr:transposase [Sinorhizobium fredii]